MFRKTPSLCLYPCVISPWECKEVREVSSLCSVSRESPLSPRPYPTPPADQLPHPTIPSHHPQQDATPRAGWTDSSVLPSRAPRCDKPCDEISRIAASSLLPMWSRFMCSAEYRGVWRKNNAWVR